MDDVLQRLCCLRFQVGDLAHPLGANSMFLVLQYADDTLLIFRGDVQQAEIINNILNDFSIFSCLCINYNKSTLVLVCVQDDVATEIAQLFGCTISSFLCTYLGLPLSLHKITHGLLLPVIHKVDRRLSG